MRKCPYCGTENPEDAASCAGCDAALEPEKENKPALLGSMGRKTYRETAPAAPEPRRGTGLAGSMGKIRYESRPEEGKAPSADGETEKKTEERRGTGLAGSMGKVRYEEEPAPLKEESPPELHTGAGFAGAMGKVRYGTKPREEDMDKGSAPPPPTPSEPEPKGSGGRSLVISLSLALAVVAAVAMLIFRVSLSTGAQSFGKGLGGFINYYAPITEEEIREEDGVRYVGDQMLIVSAMNVSFDEMEDYFSQQNMTIVGYVELIDTYQVRLDQEYSLQELHTMANRLEQSELVDSATINAVRENTSFSAPSDPWGGNATWNRLAPDSSNWGMMAIGAPTCWQRYEPEEIRVGVIDTLFDPNQPDLSYAIVKDNELFENYPGRRDDSARCHGTHVSAIIGAIHGNGVGLAGVAENCTIYAYSSFNYEGTIDTVAAIAELAAQNVRVINYSMGYIDEIISAARDANGMERDIYFRSAASFSGTALNHLLEKGYDFVLVCAAGNDPIDSQWTSEFNYISYPAVRDRILVVGAAGLDRRGQFFQADFSAIGSRVDVLAPGVNVFSAVPDGEYEYWSGTSMAAPFVSGVCASMWAVAPDLSGAEIARLLVKTADIDVPNGSAKMINMAAAMQAAAGY